LGERTRGGCEDQYRTRPDWGDDERQSNRASTDRSHHDAGNDDADECPRTAAGELEAAVVRS